MDQEGLCLSSKDKTLPNRTVIKARLTGNLRPYLSPHTRRNSDQSYAERESMMIILMEILKEHHPN